MNRRLLAIAVGVALELVLSLVVGGVAHSAPRDAWVGTWEAAPANSTGGDSGYPNYSIRNVVHTSVGGKQVRVRLSNKYGTKPLPLGHVTVGVQAKPGTPEAVSTKDVTFHGALSTTVAVGADVLSDPVPLALPPSVNLLVTTYVPTPSGPVTFHPLALQTSFFTRAGDHAGDTSGAAFTERTTVWHYVTGVDVLGPAAGSVVTLGDSITDGAGSTADANRRWPDFLAQRLLGQKRQLGVQNAGISGNRILLDGGSAGEAALKRFDEDVLSRTGVRTLAILEGINDIQQTPHETDPSKIENGLAQLARRAHQRGLRVVGATITPFRGWGSYTDSLEAVRVGVNHWIRTSGVFDSVVDLDKVIADPAEPRQMLKAYDCGDHLHPGDAGYQAMANAFDLSRL
ncbi:SGNH/GDSL hydrolase family protein [Kutzneria albida]|uniref:SGNH hydrolase-type esterase domain-containing protein n=1 Tax=Kutzneria albida DSM 43870 TaxID=1449976 RepID=W5WNJ2_9PSEU|nr:SGNH/GDSL hydrolase family protein [Kutzneria albida]AHI02112.1 hypothetical protein KALB_8755 [Kutzneria albida DSM 43870]